MKDSDREEESARTRVKELEGLLSQQSLELAALKAELAQQVIKLRQVQEAFRGSERYNRNLFELSPIGLALCHMDGTLIDVNPAYAKIIGRTIEETLTLTYWDITPKKYAAMESLMLESLKKTGRYGPYEKEYIHKDGRHVAVQLSGLIMNRGRESFILSSAEDITARKKAEEEAGRTRTFLNSIIENIPNMVFVKEAKELRFTLFNRAGENLLGYPRSSLIGKNDYDLFPKDEADFFTFKDREVFTKGAAIDIPEEEIHTLKGVRLLHTKKVPLYNERGAPLYLLGISEDITEKKQTEQELLRQAEKLARSKTELEQLELFAFAATHDLQEPLRTIIFYADLLKSQLDAGVAKETKTSLSRIQKSASRMRTMMEQLRELSRIETGGGSFTAVHLEGVIQEVVGNLELLMTETAGRLEKGPLPVVLGDPTQIHQIFQNLITNALKFHKPEVPPIIRIHGREIDNGFAEITVQDNGIGFDERYLDRIFKPFQRLHGHKEYPGSGIGLTICQKIIARHGGKISAKSKLGRGAEFVITLPTPGS